MALFSSVAYHFRFLFLWRVHRTFSFRIVFFYVVTMGRIFTSAYYCTYVRIHSIHQPTKINYLLPVHEISWLRVVENREKARWWRVVGWQRWCLLTITTSSDHPFLKIDFATSVSNRFKELTVNTKISRQDINLVCQMTILLRRQQLAANSGRAHRWILRNT